jgi:tRNA(adenine34) deaminase
VGAVVVDKNGTILGEARNMSKSKQCAHKHAELLALEQACKHPDGAARLDGATLYVTLEPCFMCFGACMLQHIQRIVYGAPSPRFGAFSCGAIPLKNGFTNIPYNHRIEIQGGICEQESVNLLQSFFRTKIRLSKISV